MAPAIARMMPLAPDMGRATDPPRFNHPLPVRCHNAHDPALPPRSVRALFAVLMFLGLSLAGCLGSGETTDPADARPPSDLLPPLDWDVRLGVDWWEHLATSYVKHDTYTPANGELRGHLVQEMEALGFDVEVRTYHALPRDPTPAPELEPLEVHAVVATKLGTEWPEKRIGLVSHYDTQTATVHGAYDDASGVSAEYNICKSLAAVPLRHTLACIFFDAEEQGLVASKRYVEDVVLEGDEPYTYEFVLGYDMTGINWPGYPDWKMYVMVGENVAEWLGPFTRNLMHDRLGYPTDGVEVLDVHDRNSDERRFKEAGVPILRFAGGRNANDYPQYHKPLDTVDYVYDFVGGRPNFEAGFATIVEASHHTIRALDAAGAESLQEEAGLPPE